MRRTIIAELTMYSPCLDVDQVVVSSVRVSVDLDFIEIVTLISILKYYINYATR